MNPFVEDPESWACDCYENMVRRCNEIENHSAYTDLDGCLVAQYCLYPRVCDWWKEVACQHSNTKAIMDVLQDPSVLMVRSGRRAAGSESEGALLVSGEASV